MTISRDSTILLPQVGRTHFLFCVDDDLEVEIEFMPDRVENIHGGEELRHRAFGIGRRACQRALNLRVSKNDNTKFQAY